jgi:single-strand DNA-binding protein
LKKGRPVFVEGRLQSRSWEAQDGSKRSTLEVVAQNVQFLSSRTSQQTGPGGQVTEDAEAAIFEEQQTAPASEEAKSLPRENRQPDEDIPF